MTDIVLKIKAATEGNQRTLDFIPGSCFLGVVSAYYDDFKEDAMEVFHSGKIRFGDAHPAYGNIRTLRIPASMYYPKIVGKSKLYIHHLYNREADIDGTDGMPQQLKQCREGFYAFSADNHIAYEVKTDKTFSLKSGYDREQRRSEDSLMYGYESIGKGNVFYFEVEVDDDKKANTIQERLTGNKHVGKSRSAQYGMVYIEPTSFVKIEGQRQGKNGLITVYADSRLIFLDDNGQPTFRPTPEQLGINDKDAEIDWNKSQIRTFQYAPWNGKRQSYDTDRCGIEKGSVFVVKSSNDTNSDSSWLGCYRNEGFGHVIYNPIFIEAEPETNGLSLYKLKESDDNPPKVEEIGNTSDLICFLKKKQEETNAQNYIYSQVNKFVDENKHLFTGASFASQWGTIRSLAMQYPSVSKLKMELYEKKVEVKKSRDGVPYIEEKPAAYLTHGVAAEKWKQRKRLEKFKVFVRVFESYKEGKYVQQAVINLAAEMAKISI